VDGSSGSRRRLPPHLFENAVHGQLIEAGYAVASVDIRGQVRPADLTDMSELELARIAEFALADHPHSIQAGCIAER
jgi:hypothetical protein